MASVGSNLLPPFLLSHSAIRWSTLKIRARLDILLWREGRGIPGQGLRVANALDAGVWDGDARAAIGDDGHGAHT